MNSLSNFDYKVTLTSKLIANYYQDLSINLESLVFDHFCEIDCDEDMSFTKDHRAISSHLMGEVTGTFLDARSLMTELNGKLSRRVEKDFISMHGEAINVCKSICNDVDRFDVHRSLIELLQKMNSLRAFVFHATDSYVY